MASITADVTSAGARSADRPRRLAGGVLFVAVWVAIGLVTRVEPDLYLLLGSPLTIAFQLLVACRPLRELWVRGGPAFRLDRGVS